jgi:hypothetical protein
VARYFFPDSLPLDPLVYALAAVALVRARDRRALVLVVPVLAAIAFTIKVGGDWMHSFRFMVPAAAFVAALVGRATAALVADRRRAWGVAGVGALLALCALHTTLHTVRATGHDVGRTRKPLAWIARLPRELSGTLPARLPGVTRWTMDHVAPGQKLATGDIGFPAWASEADVVDLVGLTDATLARLVPANDAAGYAAYLRAQAPEWFVIRLSHGRTMTRYDELTLRGHALEGYRLADSVQTYGEGSAYIWRRADVTRMATRAEALARYDAAVRWNPHVGELAAWRDTARARLTLAPGL